MQLSESIRARVIDFFLDNGADATMELQEVILLSNGHYNGRRFYCGNLQAIWLPLSGELSLMIEDMEQARINLSVDEAATNAA